MRRLVVAGGLVAALVAAGLLGYSALREQEGPQALSYAEQVSACEQDWARRLPELRRGIRFQQQKYRAALRRETRPRHRRILRRFGDTLLKLNTPQAEAEGKRRFLQRCVTGKEPLHL